MDDLRLIASVFCKQYQTEAKVYIDDAHPSGQRHLVVRYVEGGYKDAPEFATAIPNDWTEQEIRDLITWPMKDPKAPYPAWEVPARVYGRPVLFKWWKGEKPSATG